jgi:hypothetical protein
MKKIILVSVIINLFIICSFGQDSYIKGRLNFKTGYARYFTRAGYKGNYRIEGNYGISSYIELGAYFGYSHFDYLHKDSPDSIIGGPYSHEDNNTLFYGAAINFHLLPFLIKEDDFRFDLYGTAKAGGLYFQKHYDIFLIQNYQFVIQNNNKKNLFEYSIGGGMAFYLGKHLGVYGEYTFGKYYLIGNHQLRYGLTLKF